MTVPEPDRHLINGGFEEIDGIPSDRIWLTRHLATIDGYYFSIYYLKMHRLLLERGRSNFLDQYIAHTGTACPRKLLYSWCRILEDLEELAAKTTGMQELSSLKMGRYHHK